MSEGPWSPFDDDELGPVKLCVDCETAYALDGFARCEGCLAEIAAHRGLSGALRRVLVAESCADSRKNPEHG
jgi:hypothetical protein